MYIHIHTPRDCAVVTCLTIDSLDPVIILSRLLFSETLLSLHRKWETERESFKAKTDSFIGTLHFQKLWIYSIALYIYLCLWDWQLKCLFCFFFFFESERVCRAGVSVVIICLHTQRDLFLVTAVTQKQLSPSYTLVGFFPTISHRELDYRDVFAKKIIKKKKIRARVEKQENLTYVSLQLAFNRRGESAKSR